jgi:hypothetical protein
MKNDDLVNIHPMLQALLTESENRGLMLDEMIIEFGMSRVYFNSLIKGHREWGRCSRDTLKTFADFLGKTLTEIELLSGAKDLQDVVHFDASLDRELNHIWNTLKRDNRYNHLASASISEFQALPEWAKVIIAMLYHSASETELEKLLQLKKPVASGVKAKEHGRRR